jgi:hypothetical protein
MQGYLGLKMQIVKNILRARNASVKVGTITAISEHELGARNLLTGFSSVKSCVRVCSVGELLAGLPIIPQL